MKQTILETTDSSAAPTLQMAGDWTQDEWKAAEARVFALRVLYDPDALSAIYKDIAIRLQIQLTKAAPKPDPPQEFEEWWKSSHYANDYSHTLTARAAWNAARKAPSIEREMREALKMVKRRIHFIGMPQEAKDEAGRPIWEKEIAAIEAVLSKATGEVK